MTFEPKAPERALLVLWKLKKIIVLYGHGNVSKFQKDYA
jgi:hypothetical protein